MKNNIQKIIEQIEQFVDLLMPELTPYEASLYIYFFRNSFIKNGTNEFRVGKRTVAENLCKGLRGERTNYESVSKRIKGLEEKGCIKVGDTNREGTFYTVVLPNEVPLVKEKLSTIKTEEEDDCFTDLEKRKEIFERDKWACYYCGEKVTPDNATLDHFIPQCKGGKHTKDNLRTACFLCNSIKSGKTYEEAAPLLLKNVQEKRCRNNK